MTVTVQNPSSTGTASADSTSHRHSSLSGGAIAGVVIGSLAGAGILLALLFWFCYARRRPGSSAGSYDASIQGTLLDGRRHSKGSQMSMMRNIPSSPGGPTAFTDSRMNKEATLYPNGARLSNISLQDNQDYSRPVLRVSPCVVVTSSVKMLTFAISLPIPIKCDVFSCGTLLPLL